MAKTKSGLGRGLVDLFGENLFNPDPASVINPETLEDAAKEAERVISGERPVTAANAEKQVRDSAEKVVYIKITDIRPNSKQPRKQFNEDALNDLAKSINDYGVIQPVLLRPAEVGYELVAGERRWRASRIAGLKEIPAIIRDLDEKQNAFYALIENMQRENLNAMEEAEGLQMMMDDFGLSQQEAAEAVGKSRPYVSNSLRLLGLPERIRDYVSEGKLSAGHARAIAGLKSTELQLEAAEKAIAEDWSVRKIESYTGAVQEAKKRAKSMKKKAKTHEISSIEEDLAQKLGTKVTINGTEKKGSLILEYYSRDDLEELIALLMEV